MKVHQMKRVKIQSVDQVGNESRSVTLRDKLIHTPRMMHVPYPFKRRETTKIEMFEGLEKVTSNSSRNSTNTDIDLGPAVDTKLSTGTMDIDMESTTQTRSGAKEKQKKNQVNQDSKRLYVVAQSTQDDSMTEGDTDDDYKS